MTQTSSDSPRREVAPNKDVMAKSLLAALYREDCPDTMRLGEYQMGLLPNTEQAQIKTHLDKCPHCQAELSRLDGFLAEDVPSAPPTRIDDTESGWIKGQGVLWQQLNKTKQLIIRVLDEAFIATAQTLQPPTGQLAYGGTRRSGKSRKILLQVELNEGVEDLEVRITVEEKHNDPEHCNVTVEVKIASRGDWPNLGNTEVTLKRDETTVQTEITDAFGRVIFKDVNTEELLDFDFEVTPQL